MLQAYIRSSPVSYTHLDGKGLNIWDIFCKDGGHIYENQTGDAACDQYHRYKEDVQIMKEMGMKAYRFSLSWARKMCIRDSGQTGRMSRDMHRLLRETTCISSNSSLQMW